MDWGPHRMREVIPYNHIWSICVDTYSPESITVCIYYVQHLVCRIGFIENDVVVTVQDQEFPKEIKRIQDGIYLWYKNNCGLSLKEFLIRLRLLKHEKEKETIPKSPTG